MGNSRVLGTEKCNQIMVCFSGIHSIAAGFKGDGGKIVFRPCVDRQMGLCNGHCPTDSPGLKGVKGLSDDLGPHNLSGLEHALLNLIGINQPFVITLIEIYEN